MKNYQFEEILLMLGKEPQSELKDRVLIGLRKELKWRLIK